jgi:acetyl-CoA acyltransferase 1
MQMRQRVLLEHLKPSRRRGGGLCASSNLLVCSSPCMAGDSAPYARTTDFLDDVVIVAAYRTPICKAKRGGFKDTYPDDLLAPVLRAVVDSGGVKTEEVGDIVVECIGSRCTASQRVSDGCFLCRFSRDSACENCDQAVIFRTSGRG